MRAFGAVVFGVWRRTDSCALFSNKVYAVRPGPFACRARRSQLYALKGENIMQVVVVRSPKALRGILKLLFKIKDA